MHARVRHLFGPLLAASMALATAPAGRAVADPAADQARKDQARALAERGDGELEAKAFVAAEATFKEAIALVDAPTLHVRLARALVGQRRLVEALDVYETVATTDLGTSPPRPFVEAVDEAKREAEALRKRIPVVRVATIAGETEGQARVDNKSVRVGERVPLNPGEHIVSGDGLAPVVVEVGEGEQRDVDLVRASVPFPWRTTSTPVFALAGIGLFAIGLGTGFGLGAIADKADLDAACGPNGTCPPELRTLHDDYVTSSIVSSTALAIGGAALLTSVIVFAVGKPLDGRASGDETPTASVSIGPTGASLRVGF